jgi:hypothetical protein
MNARGAPRSTLSFSCDGSTSGGGPRSRFNFLGEARIWYLRHADQNALSEDSENTVVLSDEFYSEIAAHPIPTDLKAVQLLGGAPGIRPIDAAVL